MDLLHQFIKEQKADMVVMAEPNKKIATQAHWITDDNIDVAIKIVNRNIKTLKTGRAPGIVWVETETFVMFGCYISPNVDIQHFTGFLSALRREMKDHTKEILVGGDFNAKSHMWCSKVEDKRGEILAEWLGEEDLIIHNEGTVPTFVRGDSRSYLDITFSTRNIGKQIVNWRVLEEENLSLHQHVCYDIETGKPPPEKNKPKNKGWVINKESLDKLSKEFERLIQTKNGTLEAKELTEMVTRACDKTMKLKCHRDKRNPVYWWCDEVARARKKCLACKRTLARVNRKDQELQKIGCRERYKEARNELKKAIIAAKRKAWKTVIEEVEQDIWGKGYRIVTDKIKRAPPTGLDDQQQMEMASKLFPKHRVGKWDRAPINSAVPLFTRSALIEASKKVKEKKAPGPDNLPPEVVKEVIKTQPDTLLKTLNGLLAEGIFPREWKVARLVLIEKNKSGQNKAYRPICLLNVFGKLMEQLLLIRLKSEIIRTGDLADEQYGFREGRSTIHALQRVTEIADEANERAGRKRCALITIDVRNAFNSAPWGGILKELKRRQIAPYLYNIIASYLEDRWLLVGDEGRMEMTCGVPQGSVLGPTLWNIYYDGILRIPVPRSVKLIGYADDIGIVVVEKDEDKVKSTANRTLSNIIGWLRTKDLSLAPQKTEMVILAGGRTIKETEVVVEDVVIRSQESIKYLGIYLDRNMRMAYHVKSITEKATKAIGNLSRLMPNIGGPREGNRRILLSVVQSIVLYGAKIWGRALKRKIYKDSLTKVQRKAAIRVVSSYRTISTNALLVIARTLPIHLAVDERCAVQDGANRKTASETTVHRWQEEWRVDTGKGQWTQRLIPNLEPWLERGFGETTYHLTQLLSGHGCFQAYRKRFNLTETEECLYCQLVDTVEHTFFECVRWENERREIENEMGPITPENIVNQMMENEGNWKAIGKFARIIIDQKERDVRLQENR